jgi:hypothetical protein
VEAQRIAGYKLDGLKQEDPTETGRRSFLSIFASALVEAKSLFAHPQRQGQVPQFPAQIPDASSSGRGSREAPSPPPPDPKLQLQENQKNIRQEADHLLDLAKQLKEQADKTEQTAVLSLSLVKKAEEVEKLARHIKDLSRAL